MNRKNYFYSFSFKFFYQKNSFSNYSKSENNENHSRINVKNLTTFLYKLILPKKHINLMTHVSHNSETNFKYYSQV